LVVAAILAGVVCLLVHTAPSGAATITGPTYVLALGGSGSVGEQPTDLHPEGQRTDDGYSNDLYDELRASWPDLRLVKLGCPGTTTTTFLEGGDHCVYPEGTQLAAADDFLRSHPSTVLVTVDLGFNNLRSCFVFHVRVDQTCVAGVINDVHVQLAQILASLRAAAGSGTQIVGVGHFDPYLGDELRGGGGSAFAADTLSAVDRLNDTLRQTYAAAGVRMADVAAAFDTDDSALSDVSGLGDVAKNVARVCELTWACAPAPYGPNQHPNDQGYRVIAEAIRDEIVTP
jgi:lysophospholipase L1-like esterase